MLQNDLLARGFVRQSTIVKLLAAGNPGLVLLCLHIHLVLRLEHTQRFDQGRYWNLDVAGKRQDGHAAANSNVIKDQSRFATKTNLHRDFNSRHVLAAISAETSKNDFSLQLMLGTGPDLDIEPKQKLPSVGLRVFTFCEWKPRHDAGARLPKTKTAKCWSQSVHIL